MTEMHSRNAELLALAASIRTELEGIKVEFSKAKTKFYLDAEEDKNMVKLGTRVDSLYVSPRLSENKTPEKVKHDVIQSVLESKNTSETESFSRGSVKDPFQVISSSKSTSVGNRPKTALQKNISDTIQSIFESSISDKQSVSSKSSTSSTFQVVERRDSSTKEDDAAAPLRLSKQVTFGPNEEFKTSDSASQDSILSWLKPTKKKEPSTSAKDKDSDNSSVSSRASTLSWLTPNKNKIKDPSPKEIQPLERELSSGSDSYMKLIENGIQSTDKPQNLELSPKENSLISDESSLISSDFDFSPPPKKI